MQTPKIPKLWLGVAVAVFFSLNQTASVSPYRVHTSSTQIKGSTVQSPGAGLNLAAGCSLASSLPALIPQCSDVAQFPLH
jgi:hypothetical protein